MFNNQISGVTVSGLAKEHSVKSKLRPLATFSSHEIDDLADQFVAIVEGIDMPIYGFTYALDMI